MISFIVIGKNEGLVLERCFNSIVESITINNISGAEIIYIDSNSTDNSIAIAQSINCKDVSVFEITGVCNAAIARNIGVSNSKNDLLFFIDGDMEVQPEFIRYIDTNTFENNCITGHIIDYLYTHKWEFIKTKNRTFKESVPDSKKVLPYTGGIFVINKAHWNLVDGMKTKYKRSQDLDLFIRLRSKGVQLEQMPALIAKHHTIDYSNKRRMWKDLLSGKLLFEALLLRDHLFSVQIWKRTLRGNYTAFLLILAFFFILISIKLFYILMIGYFILIVLRAFNKASKIKDSCITVIKYFNARIIYQLMRDISFILGILLFFPGNKKSIYRKVV